MMERQSEDAMSSFSAGVGVYLLSLNVCRYMGPFHIRSIPTVYWIKDSPKLAPL